VLIQRDGNPRQARLPRPPLPTESPGKQIFERRCTGCHALDNEKPGPHLRGVGRSAGILASFQYSHALRKSGVTWGSATLDKWLTDTDSFMPDNDMAFQVASADERAALYRIPQGNLQ
jgi:cytochrome c